jgi:hypothetical protein
MEKCPTCSSPDPARHPAVQFEGEVQLCENDWHVPSASKIRESFGAPVSATLEPKEPQ